MTGIVTISENAEWSPANWIYWNLLDIMVDLTGDDSTAKYLLECKWMHGLDFPEARDTDPDLAIAALDVLRRAGQLVIKGKVGASVDGRILDSVSQAIFRNAVLDLMRLIDNDSTVA